MLMLKVKILAREQGRVGKMQIWKFRIRSKYESKYTNEPREKQTTKGLKHKSSRGLIVWAKEQEIKI